MRRWADLRVRFVSALVLMPFAIASIWLGGVWFAIFATAMGILIAQEYTTIVFARSTQQFALFVIAVLIAAWVGHWAESLIGMVVLTGVSIALGASNWSAWKLVGIPYVALPILALVILRDDAQWGFYAILWCSLIVWCADTLAYFAGRSIGGPKLAPILSPKKTWAGMAGAILGACLVSIIFAAILHLNIWALVTISAVFAVVEQGGDILESVLKRAHGVKDSGDLIPGHGGILDRVDGLFAVVLTATFVGYMHNPQSVAQGLLLW